MIDKPYQVDLDVDGNLRLIFDKCGTVYLSEEIPHLLATLIESNRSLQKCCTQRGERMQVMREYMSTHSIPDRLCGTYLEDFIDEHPEAKDWFNQDGTLK